MSETTSEDEPGGPDGGDTGDVLDTFVSASHDLYRRSLPPELLAELPDAEPRPGDDAPGPAGGEAAGGAAGAGRGAGHAAHALCDLTGIDAAFRLHTLARALNRAPELVPEIAPAIGLVVGEDGATPAAAEQEALTQRLAAFAAGRRDGEGLTHARWVEFVDALGGPAAVEATEAADDVVPLVDLPACNDEEAIDTPGGRAASVRSAFRTSRALSEVKPFVDPQQWVSCGRPYWTEMSLRSAPSRFSRGTSSGWVAVFREEVDVPIVGPVGVDLRIRYREAENYAVADYRLAADPEPGDKVTFDSGWLCAVTDGEDGGTHVEGLKAIRFARPIYNRLPDLACDGGWLHFMIGMALGCGGRPPMAGRLPDAGVLGVGEAGTGPAAQDDVVSALGAIADEWVGAASRSMLAHRASMTSAMERALAPTPDLRWVNDLVGMGSGVISTAEATVDAWRRSLAELGKLGGAMADRRDSWPTPQQAVGVWAGVASQIWDLSVAWLKMGVEQVAAEDRRLRSTSAVVAFPCPEAGSVQVACTRMASVAGEPIAAADVAVVPNTVDAIDNPPGTVELRVEVDRPVDHVEHLYEFTLSDGTRQVTYLRGFGVPAS